MKALTVQINEVAFIDETCPGCPQQMLPDGLPFSFRITTCQAIGTFGSMRLFVQNIDIVETHLFQPNQKKAIFLRGR
jgi:hypothetical protein